MVKVGDILKFAEPVYWWDKQFLDKGGKYIVKKDVVDVDELHLHLEVSNGGFGYGKFSQYADRPFEVVGNIFENGDWKNDEHREIFVEGKRSKGNCNGDCYSF